MFQEKCAESQEKFNEIISARKEQIAINEDIREEAEKESSFDKTLPIEMVEVKTEIPEISSDSADDSDDEKFDAALDSYPTEVKVVKEVEEEEEKIPRPLLLVVKQLPTPTGSKKVINEQPKYIFKCKECKQIFSNLLAYENHYKIAHIVSYPCQICLESFRTEEKLLNHQIATHTVNVRRELYICNACDRGFDQKYLYSQHMRNHEHESLTCLKCNKDFKSYTSLQNHKKTYHGNIHFECDQCDKTFRTSNKLSYHLKLHTELRTFICHHCGKGFMDNNGLKRHVLFVHELEAKFACHICPHKSKTEKKLAKHIQLHTAEKNIACDLCPMKFKTFPVSIVWFIFLQLEIYFSFFVVVDF